MKCFCLGVVIGISVMMGCHAMAAVPVSKASLGRRQLADCMTKQMTASRTISYNEASKVCKDHTATQAGSLSASNQAKPANAR